jgi:predicted phage terminase large subunit-like protein
MTVAPSIELKIEALYDCWAFFKLIDYHGGPDSFDTCHFNYVLVLQAPQLWEQNMFTPKLQAVWEKITESKLGPDGRPPANAILQMPRGHLKSTLVVGYEMWRVYRNPNISILHATNVRELAESFIRELRAYFEDEHLQRTVWNARPHIRGNLIPPLDKAQRRLVEETEADDKKVIWTTKQLQMLRDVRRKEATIATTSVGSKATGQHYDLVFMDDVVDMDNSSTPEKARRVHRWANDMASIRTKIRYESVCGVTPSGKRMTELLGDQFIVTGTHYEPEDYYTFLKKQAADLDIAIFIRSIYRNGVDNSAGYLWNKFTEKMERQMRAELSESPGVFEAQYLNLVLSKSLQVLDTGAIQYISADQLLQNVTSDYVSFVDPNTGQSDWVKPFIALDPASTVGVRSDYSALMVGGKTYQGKIVLLDASVGHYPTEKIVSEYVRLVKKWRCRRGAVETIGFQQLLKPLVLKALRDEQVECGLIDYKPHGNKQKRIEHQLSPYFTAENVLFSTAIKPMGHVMNTFHFFGRSSVRDDPPDAFAVVIESTHQPTKQHVTVRKLGPGSEERQLQSTQTYNARYGGIY